MIFWTLNIEYRAITSYIFNMNDPKKDNVQTILLVSGLSGAGKSTALKTLEDIGWEAVDNIPIRLISGLMDIPSSIHGTDRPLALSFDSRTRGIEAATLVKQIKLLEKNKDYKIRTLFLDCNGNELERRYAETRRRHPLGYDRPATDGIAQERQLLESYRRWAEVIIDTSKMSVNDLQTEIREKYSLETPVRMNISLTSFGFSRGVPNNVDLVFDMRFLRNPHWDETLRPLTGLDSGVSAYIQADTEYDATISKIYDLLSHILPLYEKQGKAYVNIAFGCTGGRHRSVHITETFGKLLQKAGFSPNIFHRNVSSRVIESLEGSPDQV